jgi:hypothetical protein
MNERVTRNALSRQADIHICDECGTKDAIEAFNKEVTPLADWFSIKEVLGGAYSGRCK